MKISVLLTTVLFAAGMVCAQDTGAYNHDKDKNKNKQAQTDQNGKQETVEKATKTTPSAKTKSKTVTVIGRVTAFEAGKKLEVATPKKGHRSFDLNAKDTTVNGADNIKPGEMVKVTDRVENGKHVINIEPYASANADHPAKSANHAKHNMRQK